MLDRSRVRLSHTRCVGSERPNHPGASHRLDDSIGVGAPIVVIPDGFWPSLSIPLSLVTRISIVSARRMALAAQGFDKPRPTGRIDVRHFRRVMDAVKIVQLDSVNVISRAHYLPFFARLGSYDRQALDRWLWRSGEVFEYWAHEASITAIEHRPMLAHRMKGGWHWPGIEEMLRTHGEMMEQILHFVERNGPTKVGDLDHHERTGDSWWGWSDAKRALEYLFLTGRLTARDRPGFQRVYDLPSRVHPHAVALGRIDKTDACVELLSIGARAHGVGTLHDFADYFRMKITDARTALPVLLERGDIEPVEVQGWDQPAYIHTAASRPRVMRARALLAPFDPVVWYRDRAERLFDFFYRIEIYTPAHKRVHGYYVLPFLLGDTLVGRVDLKADRKAGTLLVRGAFAEGGVDVGYVASELADELTEMARWLELDEIIVTDNGDLTRPLRQLVASR